jgi:hypothetical protein
VCRKLWRIVTTGCLDGRIGRGYRKEPEAWCFDVHYHIMQDQTSITLRPAVAHLNREASQRLLLLRLLLLSTRGHGRSLMWFSFFWLAHPKWFSLSLGRPCV